MTRVGAGGRLRVRRGSFSIKPRGGGFDRPLPVHYILPPGDVRSANIVVVMTGARRNAAEYADNWVGPAWRTDTVVLVPEFGREDFPHRWDYNAAGMVGESGELLPESQWRFSIVEALVDAARENWSIRAETYKLWGHSAGAQFVHRFVMFAVPEGLDSAMAVNPVRFTMPDFLAPFPAGLHGMPVSPGSWEKVFATSLEVVLGGDDVEPIAISEKAAMPAEDLEEVSPLSSGFAFFEQARAFARAYEVPFAWSLRVLPGIGHDHAAMAAATAEDFLGVTP